MAIVACKECSHDVSTQAKSCPNCGAPSAAAADSKGNDRRLTRRGWITLTVIALIAVAVLLTEVPHRSLTDMVARWRGERSPAPGLDQPAAALPSAGPLPSAGALRAAKQSVSPPPGGSAAVQPSVYLTSARQLYLDYSANAVATQNRIGNGLVRITGNVIEIDEDAAGHPVIELAAGDAETTGMLLNDDQRTAAAQLVKGESVGVQCEKIQRDPMQHAGAPQGRGCVLVLIDAGATPVYLALSSANDKSPLYVVGPMPESVCASRADLISNELGGSFGRGEVISKHCSATARESIPASGCQLSSAMPALPDMPDTHVWKYDCGGPAAATTEVAARPARKPVAKKSRRKSTAPAEEGTGTAIQVTEPLPPVPALPGDGPDALPAAAPVITTFQSSAASSVTAVGAAPLALPVAAAVAAPPAASFDTVSVSSSADSMAASAAKSPAAAADAASTSAASTSAAPTSAAPTSAAPTPAAPTPAAPTPAAPTPAAPTPAAVAPLPDDLSAVKSSDPAAAEHIASYCNSATAAARDQPGVAAGCRHEEVAAWKRLVVNNEFPSLDDVTRRKCNQPPFPDSYVAKESCARYQLNLK